MDRWMRAMDLPPPVVIVSSPEEERVDQAATSLSFLQRLVPFAFGKSTARAQPAAAIDAAQG
jgi:hypothetical protein